jgi:Spy/CpxP family protein refolding chaperone
MKNIFMAVASVAACAVFASSESPYTGQEARDIKALSAQEVADYLAGKGLGYAKAAELNHYPGPQHVLDMADKLALTEEQAKRTKAIFQTMQARATALGKQLVEKERELDQGFAAGRMRADTLKALLSDIARLQAEIRYAHLNAHLEQKALLTSHQIQLYDQLRGYRASGGSTPPHAH